MNYGIANILNPVIIPKEADLGDNISTLDKFTLFMAGNTLLLLIQMEED